MGRIKLFVCSVAKTIYIESPQTTGNAEGDMKKSLLGGAARIIEPASAAFDDKNDTFAKYKKKKPAAARAAQPARQLHRHGDRGGGSPKPGLQDDGGGGEGGGDDGGDGVPDKFVPDAQICAEFTITKMTLYRWTNNRDLGFPPPIHIAGRSYRSRRMIEAFKQRALRAAITAMADPTLRRKQPEALASEAATARRARGVRAAHARRRRSRATERKRPRTSPGLAGPIE
jgi:hypothetical protein